MDSCWSTDSNWGADDSRKWQNDSSNNNYDDSYWTADPGAVTSDSFTDIVVESIVNTAVEALNAVAKTVQATRGVLVVNAKNRPAQPPLRAPAPLELVPANQVNWNSVPDILERISQGIGQATSVLISTARTLTEEGHRLRAAQQQLNLQLAREFI